MDDVANMDGILARVNARLAAKAQAQASGGGARGGRFVTLAAKYGGTCRRCGEAFEAGTRIRYGGKGRTYHLAACREVEGEFPNWRQIQPKGSDPDTIVRVDAGELAELVKAALPSAHPRSSGMRFRVNEALEVEASTPDTGTFRGAIEWQEKRGIDARVALNGRYLIDVAEVLGGTLMLELWAQRDETGEVILKDGQPIEALRVVRITGAAGDALLMPMRL